MADISSMSSNWRDHRSDPCLDRLLVLGLAVGVASLASLPAQAQQPPLDMTPGETVQQMELPEATPQPTPTIPGLPPESMPPMMETSPAMDFSAALVGRNVDQVIDELTAQGWMVVVRTPQLVQLDREDQGLDLEIDPASGQIMDARMVDLS